MCPFGDPTFSHPDYKSERLPIEKIKEVIQEGVPLGLSAVRFNGLNEPLLEKSLPDLVRYAKTEGILDVFLTTNGMLLTKETSRDLIEAGVTHLMVSIDAATPETYSKIRVGGDYDKVVENILGFLEVRSRMGSRLPLLRLSFTTMKPNIRELDKFVEMWTGKVDHIAIAGYLNNIHDEEINQGLAIEKGTSRGMETFHCWQPWERSTIFANGDVFPCCMNYGREAPVGNIFIKSMKDIWQSEEVKFIQDINRAGEYYRHPICKVCISKRDVFVP
jgi:radical SAM protein with 4Fe4S-binding SPASM domain